MHYAIHVCHHSKNAITASVAEAVPVSIAMAQLLVQRVTVCANMGPNSNTRMNRAICIAITNGRSTLLEEAAMIATESAPPGLVAR